METYGGFTITDFKVLEKPVKRGLLEPHIYRGIIKNVPISPNSLKVVQFKATWDRHGRCANLTKPQYFIPLKYLPE